MPDSDPKAKPSSQAASRRDFLRGSGLAAATASPPCRHLRNKGMYV